MYPPASLLGLPRELRNMIYSTLNHSMLLPWACDEHETIDPCMCRVTTVKVHNAPLIDVLLINRQIHAEYREADCCRALRVSVHISFAQEYMWAPDDCNDTTEFEGDWEEAIATKAALARAQQVTVFVDNLEEPQEVDDRNIHLWKQVLDLVDVEVLSKTPGVSVVRLAIQQHDEEGMYELSHLDFLNGVVPFKAFSRRFFLPPPPRSLRSLPIVQRGEGYRLCFAFSSSEEDNPGQGPGDPGYIPGRTTIAYHMIVKVGVYLYARKPVNSYWTAQEVVDDMEILVGSSWADQFQAASSDERRIIEELPFQVKEWKEKRGAEVGTWGEEDRGESNEQLVN